MNRDIRRGKPNEKLTADRTVKVLKRLSKYVLRHWVTFIIAIALTLISNQLSLLGPEYSGNAIDAITSENGKGAELSIENATSGLTVPFHAGAAKYFKEKGVEVKVD